MPVSVKGNSSVLSVVRRRRVPVRHLMGSAGCGAARLKSQSVARSAACYRNVGVAPARDRAAICRQAPANTKPAADCSAVGLLSGPIRRQLPPAGLLPGLRRGVVQGALQAYLGHRNIQHTVRYTELSPGRFKDFWR